MTALITTLAVMSGFQREIRDRMLQMAAHATVSADGDVMQNWPQAVRSATADHARRRRRALHRDPGPARAARAGSRPSSAA